MISVDELRRILRMPRDGRVTMMVVHGYDEIEDWSKGYWVTRPTNDMAFVFAGPADTLKGTITYNEDEVKVEITFPNTAKMATRVA